MRIFSNEKHVVVLSKRKILAYFLLSIFVVLCICAVEMIKFYTYELREVVRIKSNNSFQSVVNEAVIDICNKSDYNFTEIVYNEGNVSTVNYNTADINAFKAEIVKYVIDNINNKDFQFRIYLSDAFNNPFFLNKGPCYDVSCRVYNGVNVECYSKFEEMGVNQTKNTIWFEVIADIYSISSVLNSNNKFKYSVAVGETIIVGNVPESYTNVAESEQTKDTVLNLQ